MNFDLLKIGKAHEGKGLEFYLSKFGVKLYVRDVETGKQGEISKDDCVDEKYLYEWIQGFIDSL